MFTEQNNNSRACTLILVHGRGALPPGPELLKLWKTALTAGLQRDFPNSPALDRVELKLVYYADLASDPRRQPNYDPVIDLADRKNALRNLVARKSAKQFRRVHYEALPGKSSIREFLADIGAPLSRALGLEGKVIARVAPEYIAYWNPSTEIATQAQERLRQALMPPLEAGNRIMLISHCLGNAVAYDTFWGLSHGPARLESPPRIESWLTLGCPLGDDYVRNRLAGGRAHPDTRGAVTYPNVLVNWLNVAAEDDYFCHDETMANDFASMLSEKLISRIKDYQIYNLSERFGKSDPHSALGYLIHPRVSRLLHDWLTASDDT